MLLENRYIFVVEDNPQNRLVFQMALTRHGAWVEFDRWGQLVVPRLKKFRKLDLIILDLMLPNNVSGYDVFDQIRVVRELDDTPIVAVTAAEPATTIPLLREKGFAGFIAKPIDLNTFPEQVARLIDGKQVWQATAG